MKMDKTTTQFLNDHWHLIVDTLSSEMGSIGKKLGDDLTVMRNEIEELERSIHQACPCLHTTPCSENCTCVNGFSSHGCRRCCSYGSQEQQKNAAIYLVQQEKELQAYRKLVERLIKGHRPSIPFERVIYTETALDLLLDELDAIKKEQ